MPDIAFINRCLGDVEGFLYSPPEADRAFGALYANDGLVVLAYPHEEHLRLVAPIVFCDEMESEDFREEVTGDTEFYREEAARFRCFLEANRCAGGSRGLSVSLHEEMNAVTLNCKALYAVLTADRLRGLIRSLLQVVVTMREELYPGEVDPELAQLAHGKAGDDGPANERRSRAGRGPAPGMRA